MHDNGWIATVFRNEHEIVEGYLWDEERKPIAVRREGRNFRKIQDDLDRVARGQGHTCSDQCRGWART